MKTTAIEVHPISPVAPIAKSRLRAKLSAYVELTKPRITSLIMLTAAAGFALGSQGSTNYLLLTHAMIGIGLLASGLGTLNQFMERDLDLLMRRTADRPLPTDECSHTKRCGLAWHSSSWLNFISRSSQIRSHRFSA